MNQETSKGVRLSLKAGQSLPPALRRQVWMLSEGVMGLSFAPGAASPLGQVLARPGDLIGAESLCDCDSPGWLQVPQSAQALTEVSLLPVTDPDERRLLATALAQARRQAHELLCLRTGNVTERVKHLLLLLNQGDAAEPFNDLALPPLKQLAALIDSAPETVCRVLSKMRGLRLIEPTASRRAAIRHDALRALRVPPGMSSSVKAAG